MQVTLLALLAASAMALPQLAPRTDMPQAVTAPSTNNDDLISSLKTSSTAVKRLQKLFVKDGKVDKDLVSRNAIFDFNKAPAAGKGGRVLGANIDNFPILTDLGIATTVAFLGPCGMNTPHVHPRATEFLTMVQGEIDFGIIPENGFVAAPNSAEIAGHLTAFQGTVFPMGSVHYQVNTGCTNATFVAALSNEDPGTGQIAQEFFGLNKDVVNATLGFPESIDGADIDKFKGKIPANLALGVEKCLMTCNIPKRK